MLTADRRYQVRAELVRMAKMPLSRRQLAWSAGVVLALIALALVAFISVGV